MTTNKKKTDARMVGTIIVNTPSSVTFTEVNATLFNSDGNNASGGFLQGGLRAWKRGKKTMPRFLSASRPHKRVAT
ncbi:hypothetical protein QZH46_17590 [Pseudomonas corrugata]